MDPYLEAPDLFPDLHHSLASAIRAQLNAALPAPYYARTQVRPELGVVLQSETAHRMDVQVRTDPFRHVFVEIRDPARGHKLITLIEIVSPSNKRPGPDRKAYEAKQQEVLESDASLIEIDLLRSGRRLLPYLELEATVGQLDCDYLVLLNRSSMRVGTSMDYTLYPIDLREMLPCIPVPLAGDDPDVPLDLQVALDQAYRGGPYLRAVDYDKPPDPPLAREDEAWADELLRKAGLR